MDMNGNGRPWLGQPIGRPDVCRVDDLTGPQGIRRCLTHGKAVGNAGQRRRPRQDRKAKALS